MICSLNRDRDFGCLNVYHPTYEAFASCSEAYDFAVVKKISMAKKHTPKI